MVAKVSPANLPDGDAPELSGKNKTQEHLPSLSYQMAIILRASKDMSLHSKLVRVLLANGLKIGILAATRETKECIIVLVDPLGIETMGVEYVKNLVTESVESGGSGNYAQDEDDEEAVEQLRQSLLPPLVSKQVLRRESSKPLKQMMSCSTSREVFDKLTPAEELVITEKTILKALGTINIHKDGYRVPYHKFDHNETELEEIIIEIFPLQDDVWNKSFFLKLKNINKDSNRISRFYHKWIVQNFDDTFVPEIRNQYGDRKATYFSFVLHYRKWIGYLAIFSTLFHFIKFFNWGAYVSGQGLIGFFCAALWGPLMSRCWSQKCYLLSFHGKKKKVLSTAGAVRNPHITRGQLQASWYTRNRRRRSVAIVTILFLILNVLILIPVSFAFTQWYAYGKMAPSCKCCQFLLDSGLGNGSALPAQIDQSLWPPQCEEYKVDFEDYFIVEPEIKECIPFATCFWSSKSTLFNDRWWYIVFQGIALGLILDIIQTYAFQKFTEWLARQEAWETLELYDNSLIRKQFFFIWLNMFFWYLTITFVYAPFGQEIQKILYNSVVFRFAVPAWGWRPGKISLDKAFVTPMLFTSFANFFIYTFVPLVLCKLELRAKNARRTLLAKYDNVMEDVKEVAAVAVVNTVTKHAKDVFEHRLHHQTSKEHHVLKDNQEIKKPIVSRHSKQKWSDHEDLSEALFFEVEDHLDKLDCLDAKGLLHFHILTPDKNKYDATEIYTQSLLPTFDINNEYLDVILQFGYVSMFSAAWGLMPIAAWFRLLLEFRGDCYKLMFGTKRAVPRASEGNIGEWQNSLYLTSLLAITVVSAQYSFSTGGLDFLLKAVGVESESCQLKAALLEVMTPDLKNCEKLNWAARVASMVLLEHIGIGILAAVFVFVKSKPGEILAKKFELNVLKNVVKSRENSTKYSNLSSTKISKVKEAYKNLQSHSLAELTSAEVAVLFSQFVHGDCKQNCKEKVSEECERFLMYMCNDYQEPDHSTFKIENVLHGFHCASQDLVLRKCLEEAQH